MNKSVGRNGTNNASRANDAGGTRSSGALDTARIEQIPPLVDASHIFRAVGIEREARVRVTSHTYADFQDAAKAEDSWLYLAFRAFQNYGSVHPVYWRKEVKTFATIGTGSGVDAIGAHAILQPEKIVLADIHPEVIPVAEQNVKTNLSGEAHSEIVALPGNLCEPLVERGITADLIYANLPNIPSGERVLGERRSATFFEERAAYCPAVFEEHLLKLQYLFLESAKKALSLGGVVIAAIGARVPGKILERLFKETGYHGVHVLARTLKRQSEPEHVLRGYAEAEKRGVEFDFYRYAEASERWKSIERAGVSVQEAKEELKKHRVSASEAWKLYSSGAIADLGIIACAVYGKKFDRLYYAFR